jgi:phosphoglycolate phosphatase
MKGFLFDLDGTLVDTAIDMLAALSILAQENGIQVKPDYHQSKELITYGSRALVASIFGQLSEKKFKTLQSRYLEIYHNNLLVDSKLFNGIEKVIQQLDQANIPWGIVTNKPTYLAKPLITAIQQLNQCKIIVGGGCTQHSKPHPMPILHAIEQMQIDPKKSWYIGDAHSDIMAANAAKMNSAVAKWGYLKADDKIETWNANSILTNSLEILNL